MAKPIKHRGKWRIRWKDSNGKRRSEVFADYNDAKRAASRRRRSRPRTGKGTR